MQAIKELPANYHLHRTLDLSSMHVILRLNLLAFVLMFLFGWLFTQLINLLRSSNPFPEGMLGLLVSFSGWGLIALPLSIIFMLIFHELIHGMFFWIYTRDRPKFALRSGYAFAAAPGWYLPRIQYIWVGLSPLVIISITSLLLAWIVPVSLVPYLLLISSTNAAGSLGDMIVTVWVLKLPASTLIKDEGDNFQSFIPMS
jgi:Putative zincin peptidase